eukprot:8131040-Pyramimonas_sp.AAC.1
MSHSSAAASACGGDGLSEADMTKIAGKVAQMIRLGTGAFPASAPPEDSPNLQALAGPGPSAAPTHEAGWSMVDDWRDCDPWREEWKTNTEWAEPATKLASADDKYTPPSMRTTDAWKAWRDGSWHR